MFSSEIINEKVKVFSSEIIVKQMWKCFLLKVLWKQIELFPSDIIVKKVRVFCSEIIVRNIKVLPYEIESVLFWRFCETVKLFPSKIIVSKVKVFSSEIMVKKVKVSPSEIIVKKVLSSEIIGQLNVVIKSIYDINYMFPSPLFKTYQYQFHHILRLIVTFLTLGMT